MIESLVVYDLAEVKKKLSLAKIKTWYKGDLIKENQWSPIKEKYESNLFSPAIFMRILLFVATYLGLITILGPILLLVADEGMSAIRTMIFIVGAIMLVFTERVLIKSKRHFKSGVTEAGCYTGLSFIYFGLMGTDIDEPVVYWLVGFLFLLFSTIRYMDLLSMVCAIGCFIAIVFLSLESILAYLPFVIMILFSGLFLVSQQIQKTANELIWEDHFIVFDTLALLLVYLGGNYFVVRELSIEMMGLHLIDGEDIPFAFLFYGFTFLIPIAYLAWGILKKSIIFIRVSLLTLALSVITIKWYYSLGYPEVTITVSGGILIVVALALMKYLKKSRNGYTRDQIFTSKWDNSDLAAFVASQTLGGHQITETQDGFSGQGGEFGGGGASGEF